MIVELLHVIQVGAQLYGSQRDDDVCGRVTAMRQFHGCKDATKSDKEDVTWQW